jgi:neutral ceramidase
VRRIIVLALVLFAALPATASAALRAGAARVDFTPENGGTTLGFVRPDITVKGVHTRLTARVLVLADGDTKVALLATDLGFALEKDSLVARVRDLGYGHDTILYSGTHTHSGPGELADWQVEQLAEAIRRADAQLRPAVAGWSDGRVDGVNRNRSIEAHLANHGIDQFYGEGHPEDDPLGTGHTADERLRVLRVQGTDGRPIAAWMNYPVHLTTSTPAADLWDADLAAPAERHLEAAIGDGAVALFNNGSLGDLMPRFDAYNPTAVMDLHGLRIAEQAWRAWAQAGRRLRGDLPVDVRWTRACYCGQEVEPGRRVSSAPVWGLPFLGGSEDGASIFHEPLATEGRRLPPEAADPVQGRKIPAAPGLVHETHPEVQVVRIGDRLLLAAPGEPSVEMGRRFEAAVRPALPGGVREVFLVSLANDYLGYLTTPEEYEMQHYEGGHTVYGIWTSLVVRDAFVSLARAMGHGLPAPEPSQPAELGSTAKGTPAVGDGGVAGSLEEQPPEVVERMQTVSISWTGAERGVDRPLDAPFVALERRTRDGWRRVDDDLGLSFAWSEAEGRYTARYDVGPGVPAGEHRLRVTSGAYDLATRPFRIAASDGLIVRGAETQRLRRRRARLVVRVQNPPPDPARAIRWRPRSPRGGFAVIRVAGRGWLLRFNEREDAWTAVVPARWVRPGAAVRIGMLRDEHRNRPVEEPVTVRVGEMKPVRWPTNMGVGGGRTPGPFGQGEFPP